MGRTLHIAWFVEYTWKPSFHRALGVGLGSDTHDAWVRTFDWWMLGRLRDGFMFRGQRKTSLAYLYWWPVEKTLNALDKHWYGLELSLCKTQWANLNLFCASLIIQLIKEVWTTHSLFRHCGFNLKVTREKIALRSTMILSFRRVFDKILKECLIGVFKPYIDIQVRLKSFHT